MDVVEANFASIYQGCIDKREYIREGFLGMLIYMPLILDLKFEKFISDSLIAAIDSIAHQNEIIRNLAIKIVKNIIQKFSIRNMNEIQKSLFDGMFADNYLKRNSSIILLGDVIDVLFKESGTSKEDIYKNNSKLFSALYIVRNDDNTDVKISTNNIWKVFVENTNK